MQVLRAVSHSTLRSWAERVYNGKRQYSVLTTSLTCWVTKGYWARSIDDDRAVYTANSVNSHDMPSVFSRERLSTDSGKPRPVNIPLTTEAVKGSGARGIGGSRAASITRHAKGTGLLVRSVDDPPCHTLVNMSDSLG